MNKFVISIGPEGMPWAMKFNALPLMGVGAEGDYSEEKTRPLILLALYTEWKRSTGGKLKKSEYQRNDSLCPSLKSLDVKTAKILSEAICNNKNYVLHPKKNKQPRDRPKKNHWLVEIFGKRPLDGYLTGNRHDGDAAFTADVKIEIWDDRDGRDDKIVDPEEIERRLRDYSHGIKQSARIVYLALKLEENGERPASIIDINSCEGSFRNNAKYWISLEANFVTNFHVFWISPDESYLLCPSEKYKHLCEKSKLGSIPSVLKIAEYDNLTIAPPTGNQICVVLMTDKSIPENLCKSIEYIICDTIPKKNLKKSLLRPELKKNNIPSHTAAERGIVIPEENSVAHWQDKLAAKLSDYTGILYVFSVPHV